MIDKSQYIIAVCRNGRCGRSEVEQAVEYAGKWVKGIIFIHSETAEVTNFSEK